SHSYEEFSDLYEHLSKQHKQEKKCTWMIRIQNVMKNQWMPKLEAESEALQVNITTCVEAACAKEALQQKPTITKEE
ncbi:hypothetical protein KI387_003284, partial [Taxus chinensis]